LWAVPSRSSHRARGVLSAALAAVACCVLAPHALAAPRLTPLAGSSSECVFDFDGVAGDCESTDPTFEVEFTSDDGNGNDSSGCTYSASFDWGDGSPIQTVTFTGTSPGNSEDIVNHTYLTPGTYTITNTSATVVSNSGSGSCGFDTLPPVQFTLDGGDSPVPVSPVPVGSALPTESAAYNEQLAVSDAQSASAVCTLLFGKPPRTDLGIFAEKDDYPRLRPMCNWLVTSLTGDSAAAGDPPVGNFLTVFEPQTFAVPVLPRACLRLRGTSCVRLRGAELTYLTRLANVASLSEAVGVTGNRFGGAKQAGDLQAEGLQRVAEAKYLPLQASAVTALQQAGRQFAAVLRSDHLNTVLTAKQVAQGRKQLGNLDEVPSSLITSLERDGVTTSRNALRRTIAGLLKKQPPARATPISQILAAP